MNTKAYGWLCEDSGRIFLPSIAAPEAMGVSNQVAAIMQEAQKRLETYGATLTDIRKLVVAIIDGEDRAAVLQGLAKFFPSEMPCCSIFVANGLADPRSLVQIEIDAWRGASDDSTYSFPYSEGAVTVSRVGDEVFLSAIDGFDGSKVQRSLKQASIQAKRAMGRLLEALEAVDAGVDDICKITVHVPDRYYREAVYPEIGRLLREVFPVSTGLVLQGLAHAGALFSIDVLAIAGNGHQHLRERKYHTSETRYGGIAQKLDCSFSMAIRAQDRIFLRGQTGMDLSGVMHGHGDVVAQTEKAMENIVVLLADVGAETKDIVRIVVFVTDPAYLEPVHQVVSRYCKDDLPVLSSVVVKGLAAPNLLMELDVLAMRPK